MKNARKIQVLNAMNDPRTGGPQLSSLAVARRLRERGIEIEFLLPDGSDDFSNMARDEDFTVHRPGISRVHSPKQIRENAEYLIRLPIGVKRICEIITEQNIDVVHTKMSTSFCSAIAASLSAAGFVWTFNDTLVPAPLKNISGRAAMALADEIIVVADNVDEYYFPQYADTTTIYAPVDVSEFDPNSVQPASPVPDSAESKDPFVVGTVANVNPIKGHEYFIRAIAAANDRLDRPIHAPIVGAVLDSRRDYYKELLALCEDLGVEENVHFLGKRDDVPALLAGFDVFVLASVAEACPMVVLEAMAMERPVVATRVGGVPEQINDGEHGWVVPPEDSDRIAAAIVDALDNENEARRRAARARNRVRSKFSLEQCVTRHEELYRNLA